MGVGSPGPCDDSAGICGAASNSSGLTNCVGPPEAASVGIVQPLKALAALTRLEIGVMLPTFDFSLHFPEGAAGRDGAAAHTGCGAPVGENTVM